jgi:hypothetical protein
MSSMTERESRALERYFDELERVVFEVRDRVKALEAASSPPDLEAAVRKALADSFQGAWEEREYPAGSLVVRSGSTWLARETTSSKPGDADSGWAIVAKAGRDGRR